MATFGPAGRYALSLLESIKRVLGWNARMDKDNAAPIPLLHEDRVGLYQQWKLLYSNGIYDTESEGGMRETLLRDLIDRSTSLKYHGFYNPVACIVDAYQNCLRGQYGREIVVAEEVDGRPVNPKLLDKTLDPLGKIWRWSNLNEQKAVFQFLAACMGSAGLRIETKNDADPLKKRVRVVPVHPGQIEDFEEDAQGNVTAVRLKYKVYEGPLGERDTQPVEYIEELDKTSFRRWRDEKAQEPIENVLGVCPFVLLRHRDIGAEFGVPSFYGSDKILHQINWLFTRLGISVDRHVFAKWFAAAGGPPPTTIDLGDTAVAYVQTNPGDTQPKLEAIVAKLDFIGIQQVLVGLIGHVRQRHPELTLTSLEALSGQSGETIDKLLVPCKEKILEARGRYEHALARALKVALSWGIVFDMWDLGTGMGESKAADLAYETGKEDFAFKERSALPETSFDQAKRVESEQKDKQLAAERVAKMDFASNGERMRELGWDETRIARSMKETAAMDAMTNTQP